MSCLREYETEMHLSLFRSNLFLEHQSDSKSTFDCSSIQSCMLCILEYNFKSSAYKKESMVKISLMSFINNKKSNGPRFDPCGMPELTVKRNELNPIYSTYRTLSDIYDLRRDKREGLKPKALNLLRRMLWLSLSKAFEKSVYITST
jgi:hypothetical protein